MPRCMLQGSYTAEGTKGLLKDGGSKRRGGGDELGRGAGGRLESFYYAFGDSDVVLIVEAPDAATIAGLSLVVNASGAVRLRTTMLLTPEEVDMATKKNVKYRPPGQT